MSRFMTDEEIAEEQARIVRQRNGEMPLDEDVYMEASRVVMVQAGVVSADGFTEEDDHRATPLDLLNSNNYVDRDTREVRYDLCKACPRLFKPTRTCKECGCFMAAKTWLKNADCPIGKWAVESEQD